MFQDCLDQAIAIDSIQIIDSYRLYSGYPIETNESFESYMLFNIDISRENENMRLIIRKIVDFEKLFILVEL